MKRKSQKKKIQLDIGINLVHTIKPNDRITFYVKTDNVTCLPSDNIEDILDLLIASFYEKYKDRLLLCRINSRYVYESVDGLAIHFHKIDLKRGSSYIPSPTWFKEKQITKDRSTSPH